MWRYADNLRGALRDARAPAPAATTPIPTRRGRIIDAARAEGRTLLDEHESKALLAALRHPDRRRRASRATRPRRVAAARELGFPVALKLWSRTITHKTDVGGVKLGLADADGRRAARSTRSRPRVADEGRRRSTSWA